MKYTINKIDSKLISGIAIDNYIVTSNEYLIETEEIPNKIVNIWNGSQWIEGATLQEIQDANTEPNPIDLVNLEFQKYLQRKTDGENAYLQISAEFRMAKISGDISEEAHLYIENLLKPIRNEIMFGQWMEGLRLLELIEIELIGDELYNRLHLQISNYVTENY